MTKDEFKEFYALLRKLFPYDNKSDEDIRQWYTALKDISLDCAMREIRRRKKEEDAMPSSLRKSPTPQETAENAEKYHGCGSLMWRAIRSRIHE